jgi:acetyl-CoA carboxylase carboxyltransferase component
MVAWPTAEISFMAPEIGADIISQNISEEERGKIVEKMISDSSPYPAARLYGIQDVIYPDETRDYLIKVIEIIRESTNKGMGEHLLSGWPTKF